MGNNRAIIIVAEAIFVGISLVFFAYVASAILSSSGYFEVDLPEICKKWNENHIMEWTLILTGVIGYLTFELTGINKAYADNYYKK